MTEQHDWRLQATFADDEEWKTLASRLRGEGTGDEGPEGSLAGFAVTCDSGSYFVYASAKAELDALRESIDAALREDGHSAELRISCWDDKAREWLQVDPVPSAEEVAIKRAAQRWETRTLTCSVGKLFCRQFTDVILDYAYQTGLECTVVERRRLLRVQLEFTVTAPASEIDDLDVFIRQEARKTLTPDPGMLPPV